MREPVPSLPKSLWAATAPPGGPWPALDAETEAEVCVVGGGFTGLSAALHLAEAGAKVLLLEAAEPGWGASGRNGGQIIPGLKLQPAELEAQLGAERGGRLAAFAGAAPDLVFDLIARYGIDCHARRGGWIQAVHAAAALPAAEARCADWARRGAPVEMLDREETALLLGSSAYVGGLLDRRGGSLQPLSYARGLAQAAEKAGACLYGASPATALEPHRSGWRISTPHGRVLAPQVLLCTNGYSDALWPGLARSVIPVMSYQAATRPLSHNQQQSILPHGHVCSDTRRLLAYFRLDPEGRLIVGGRGRQRESDDPADYRHVTALFYRLFPDLGTPDWAFFWGGRVALTTDHLPHLHEPAPGLLAGLGFNGRGVAMATATGKLLAQRASGAPAETLPLPASEVRPIPFHGLRLPVLTALVAWKRLRDGWEARS